MNKPNKLEADATKDLHTHYTGVKFTEWESKTSKYGAEQEHPFRPLASDRRERYTPVIISESPLLDKDALKYKQVFERTGYQF